MDQLSDDDKNYLYSMCHYTNNNFAYKYDTGLNIDSELKISNFVPTYDRWCLNCGATESQFKCGKCKSVYFCSKKCQKKCWPIHKKHCGRNLFANCSYCCDPDITIKCENCPVQWCSKKCKDNLYEAHKEFDCDNFHKLFGVRYLDY